MKVRRALIFLSIFVLCFSSIVLGEDLKKVEVLEKSLEEETEKYDIKVKYPYLSLDGNEFVEEINKTIEDYTFQWVEDVKLLAREEEGKEENKGVKIPRFEAYSLFQVFDTDEFISITMDYYQYTGGAHGLTTKVSFNYNLNTGERVKLKDLFKEGFDYKSIIDEKIKGDIEKEKELYFDEGKGFKGIDENQAYYLSREGIVIYFQQYEISPYSSGIREFKIPYKDLEEGLIFKGIS